MKSYENTMRYVFIIAALGLIICDDCVVKQDVITRRTEKEVCVDPNEQEIMKLLDVFKPWQGIMSLESVSNLLEKYEDSSSIVNQKTFSLNGIKDCVNHGNLTKIFERALCPWHNHISIRNDRFPVFLANARCNCVDCNKEHDEDTTYKCEEVLKEMPAVKRSQLCTNGLFKWDPILENVSVACVCARDKLHLLIK
jgi:hypothetical protein